MKSFFLNIIHRVKVMVTKTRYCIDCKAILNPESLDDNCENCIEYFMDAIAQQQEYELNIR